MKSRAAVAGSPGEAPVQARPPMRATRLIRRLHMYAGLIFLPWVLLYGITAFFFNHPMVMSRRKAVDSEAVQTVLKDWPTATALASEGGKALAAAPGSPGSFVSIENARYNGVVRANTKVGADRYDIQLRADDRTGSWAKLGASARRGPGDADPGLSVKQVAPTPTKASLKDGITKLSSGVLPPGSEMDIRELPTLRFEAVDAQGARWDTTWNLEGGQLSAKRVPATRDMTAREYLTRLHVTGGYPANGGLSRTAWAVIVDAVFVLMVFWGASGIVMWWQQRRMRIIGGAILSVGAATAIMLGVAMWRAFAT